MFLYLSIIQIKTLKYLIILIIKYLPIPIQLSLILINLFEALMINIQFLNRFWFLENATLSSILSLIGYHFVIFNIQIFFLIILFTVLHYLFRILLDFILNSLKESFSFNSFVTIDSKFKIAILKYITNIIKSILIITFIYLLINNLLSII